MRVAKQITLRRIVLVAWIVLALLIVAPVLAQDGGDTPPPAEQDGDTTQQTDDQTGPADLTEVAVELAPLLLGAALIERLLEYIFTLAETSLLRAGNLAQRFLRWVNGTLMVDAREIYDQYERVRRALLAHHAGLVDETTPKNPESLDPDEWPFDKVLEQFEYYGTKVAQLEEWLDTTTSSTAYINRRKNVASILGVVIGLVLAALADIRLFSPFEFGPDADWFDIVDLIASGVLMGLGTDYVHQIIAVVTKGQRYLSAATGSKMSETVRIDTSGLQADFNQQLAGVNAEIEARFRQLENLIGERMTESNRSDEQPPST